MASTKTKMLKNSESIIFEDQLEFNIEFCWKKGLFTFNRIYLQAISIYISNFVYVCSNFNYIVKNVINFNRL